MGQGGSIGIGISHARHVVIEYIIELILSYLRDSYRLALEKIEIRFMMYMVMVRCKHLYK